MQTATFKDNLHAMARPMFWGKNGTKCCMLIFFPSTQSIKSKDFFIVFRRELREATELFVNIGKSCHQMVLDGQ